MKSHLAASLVIALSASVAAQSQKLVEARTEMSAAAARADRVAFAKFLSEDITSIDSADRSAVLRALDSLRQALDSGDVQTWADLVTDDVVATSHTGDFKRKAELARDVAARWVTNEAIAIPETSVRIHGALAIANLRLQHPGSREFWRTVIFVKLNREWRQAAEITTEITGAAKSAKPPKDLAIFRVFEPFEPSCSWITSLAG